MPAWSLTSGRPDSLDGRVGSRLLCIIVMPIMTSRYYGEFQLIRVRRGIVVVCIILGEKMELFIGN